MTKIRCNKCDTIIEGDKKGTLIWCKCKNIAIDENRDFCRIIGYEENYEEVKEVDEVVNEERGEE